MLRQSDGACPVARGASRDRIGEYPLPPLRSPSVSRALILAVALLAVLPAQADPPPRRFTVTPTVEGYACEAVMRVAVPIQRAWEVMTDFEAMSRFVPNLRQSHVTRREGSVIHVEQVGVAHFGPLAFEFTLERRLELTPPRMIVAESVRGTIRRYRSTLYLTAEREGTRLTYRVDLEPGLLAGTVLSREFLEHELREQLLAMEAEMLRREAAAEAAAGVPAAGR